MASFSLTQKGSVPKTTNPFNGKGPQSSFGASPSTTASSKPIQQATPAQAKVMSTALGTNPGMINQAPKSNISAPGAITSLSGYSPIPQQNTQKSPLDSYGSGNKDVKSTTSPDGTKIDFYSDNVQSNKQQNDAPQEQYKINPDLYGQITTGLANQAQNPTYSPNPAISGLMGFGNNTDSISPQIKDALSKISDIDQAEAATAYNLNNSGIDLGLATGQQGELAKKFGAQRAGYSGLLSGLMNQRSQNIGAVGSAGGLGVQAQGQTQGALGTAAGLAAPQFPSYQSAQFNPVTGQYGSVGGGQYGSGPQAAANVQLIQDYTKKYAEGTSKLQYADGLQNQIVSTLQSNPQLNNQPLSSITNLNQLLSGQVSSGPQQLLSQQISNYIQALGLDTGTALNIANQQQGTLAQLLDSLRQTAEYQNEAYNPSNIQGGGQNSSDTSSGSGDIWDF